MLGAPRDGESHLVCHVRSVQGAAAYWDCQERKSGPEWFQAER